MKFTCNKNPLVASNSKVEDMTAFVIKGDCKVTVKKRRKQVFQLTVSIKHVLVRVNFFAAILAIPTTR